MRAATFKPPSILLRIGGAILFLAILFGINAWMENPNFDQNIESIVVTCGIYVLLAVALNIVNGFTGQFSLGHIGFYAIGAYVAAALTTYGHDRFFRYLPEDGSAPTHLALGHASFDGPWVVVFTGAAPMLASALVAGLVAAAVGWVVGLPSLRLRGDYLAILTLGFAQIVQVILQNTPAVNGNTSFTGIQVHDRTISTPHITDVFWVYLFAAAAIVVSLCLRYSTHGLAFMAVRDDEVAAEAMGINTTRYKVAAFVLSAFFTGIAGALFGLYQSQLSNDQFGFMNGVDVVVMVVLGGLGSVSGVAIAAILLRALPETLRNFDQYRLVVFPLLLILLMLTRPQGIFGREELTLDWLKGQTDAVWNAGMRLLKQGPPAQS